MLLDDFMPEFEFREKHETSIDAPAEKVFAAIRTFDTCESAILRWLCRLHRLPKENMTLSGFERMGFTVLEEQENEEILIGLAGKFWKMDNEVFRERGDDIEDLMLLCNADITSKNEFKVKKRSLNVESSMK